MSMLLIHIVLLKPIHEQFTCAHISSPYPIEIWPQNANKGSYRRFRIVSTNFTYKYPKHVEDLSKDFQLQQLGNK